MVIQVLVTILSAYIILRAYRSYRKKTVRIATFLLWSFFWLLMIFVVWQPDLTNRLASLLQVGRGADAVLYLSLVLIFYLIFKIYVKLEAIDAEMTTLVREVAIIERKRSSEK